MANPYAPPQAVVADVVDPRIENTPAERGTRLAAAILDSFIVGAMVGAPIGVGLVVSGIISAGAGERAFTPQKGAQALNALMGVLYSIQPTPTHSDYIEAAERLLRAQQKRALVIVVTNFRDEDSTELRHALRLLRSRHLVLLASVRERVVRELMSQPLGRTSAAIEVASAHLYEQARRYAFVRLAARDSTMVDAEPERLGIDLVNRYKAIKRAGLI